MAVTAYEKPSKMVIHKSSAMGWPVKRATLMAEVYKRLYNTDSLTTWQEKAHMINCLVGDLATTIRTWSVLSREE